MRGNATLTTDSSTKAIVDPSTAAASTHDLRLAHAGTPGLERITASSHGNAFGLPNQCVSPTYPDALSRAGSGIFCTWIPGNQELVPPFVERRIIAYHQDDEGHFVAELECGHQQHVRHRPPWINRPWVTSAAGRRAALGTLLDCRKCDPAELKKQP